MFEWPRAIRAPLKRGGHVVIDACTAKGELKRMIVPKSQGKQIYYDARKLNWGDLFPHQAKTVLSISSIKVKA